MSQKLTQLTQTVSVNTTDLMYIVQGGVSLGVTTNTLSSFIGAQTRATLGTMSSQNSSAISVTGGTLSGVGISGSTMSSPTLSGGSWSGGAISSGTINSTSIQNSPITLSSVAATTLSSTSDATIYGLTVGRGPGALSSNTTFGFGALTTNTLGGQNTAIGCNSLYNSADTTGTTSNVGLGYNSGYACTTGINNVFLGTNAGNDALVTITTTSNNVVLGNNDTTTIYAKTATITTSDARDKTNIVSLKTGLDFVKGLKPMQYQFRISRKDETPSGPRRLGFLAQDVLALEGGNPIIINNDDPENLKICESYLIPILVNAIKELEARLVMLESK